MALTLALWLGLAGNVLGFLGAVLLAIPFLSDTRLKRLLLHQQRRSPISDLEPLRKPSATIVRHELERIRPGEWWCFVIGLACVAVSYLLASWALLASP
jgi:hypothetical protein